MFRSPSREKSGKIGVSMQFFTFQRFLRIFCSGPFFSKLDLRMGYKTASVPCISIILEIARLTFSFSKYLKEQSTSKVFCNRATTRSKWTKQSETRKIYSRRYPKTCVWYFLSYIVDINIWLEEITVLVENRSGGRFYIFLERTILV